MNISEVRASIKRYQDIVLAIEQIEKKLKHLQRVDSQFRNWGRNLVKEKNASWLAEAMRRGALPWIIAMRA